MDCTITPIRWEDRGKSTFKTARQLRLGGLSVIQTTDTLYPLIPDPFQFGRFVCVLNIKCRITLLIGLPAHLYSPPCMQQGSPASTISSAISPYLPGEQFMLKFVPFLYGFVSFNLVQLSNYYQLSTRLSESERDKVVPLILEGYREAATEAGSSVSGWVPRFGR